MIDHDETVLKTAQDSLVSLGAKADIANNGEIALKMIIERKDNPYRIVIVDHKLSDVDGVDLIKDIKKITKEETTSLLMSAYDWSEVEKVAKSGEIAGFIFKPFFQSRLFEKIVELVNPELKINSIKEEETYFEDITVLVVEDNEINWEIISALLDMHGVVCERAENGKVALDLLSDIDNEYRWDLVFMDIQMPVMNGLDATRAIRQIDREFTKNIPIIAMTADAFSENVAECLKAGMNGHIAKPVELNLVLNEIRKIHAKKNK